MGELRLEAREFESLARWRWVLTGPGNEFLADHQVWLDVGCWQFGAFADLVGYLRWHAAPDRRIEDEARIVAGVGEWIGREVLGPVGAAALRARPATVTVIVPAEPEEAQALLYWPLELAHVAGRPLAVQGVTLVMRPGDDGPSRVAPVQDRLRVLGLFSLPVGGQPLNLRRERHALVRLLSGIGAVDRAVDMRVLQYGVTRARLRDVLEEAEGWDVIHVSGHGAPGELLLETEAGAPDPVTASQLADLLDLARERLKLVSLSTCWSAALAAAQQRLLLGLPVLGVPGEDEAGKDEAGRPERGWARPVGVRAAALAARLSGRMGCAVLAMRYPVTDDFAIALAGKLYELLAGKGQPLPRALGLALDQVVACPPTASCPALSVATPALFGARAAGLRLAAPSRAQPEHYDASAVRMAGFPEEPDRFVGRTAVMAQASATLARESGLAGLLLHGMPGGGKTACALELAYTHEHAFDRLVWFKAPDGGRDISTALADFALTLERNLPGLQIVHLLEDAGKLAAFLPRLTALLERRRALIVADNIESLLSESGQWRDDRWGQVINALCGHAGLGRVVLTSRRSPAGLDGRVRRVPVDALSLDEALLLARQLPHLRRLIEGDAPGVRPDGARSLALGVLNVAQGHPKLLELADGQAGDPARLNELVEAGGQVWREGGGLPEGFFTTGQAPAASEDYLPVLMAWTKAVAERLVPSNQDLFWFLCCLEEPDRNRHVVDALWADLRRGLGRPAESPDLDAALAAIASFSLLTVHPGTDQAPELYGIHPAVAAAGNVQAGDAFREEADTQLADLWGWTFNQALLREDQQQTGHLVVKAGLSAAPYLLRLDQWRQAGDLLEQALIRDHTTATASAVLPALRAIVRAVAGSPDEAPMARVMANALEIIDPAAAEQSMRKLLTDALARDDYRVASMIAGDLRAHALRAGKRSEALGFADAQIGYARRAGQGPLSQLWDEAMRLQVRAEMGEAEEVFAESRRLLRRLKRTRISMGGPEDEDIRPWAIREILLDVGCQSACGLEHWQDALDLHAELTASLRSHGSPEHEVARSTYNSYSPLLRLGRVEEARVLLLECRDVFEDANDLGMLAKVFTALADLEDSQGHGEVAVDLQYNALRYNYLCGDAAGVAVSHHNLGSYLYRHAGQPSAAFAHQVAGALIRSVTGGGSSEDDIRAVAWGQRTLGSGAAVPTDLAQLSSQVGEVPGVDLHRLLAQLAPDPSTAERALMELIGRSRALAGMPAASPPVNLVAWDPVIAALLAARSGSARAGAEFDKELTYYPISEDWSALVGVLRRLRAGETDPDLLAGLDEIDTAIASRALDALTGRVTIPPGLWRALRLRWLRRVRLRLRSSLH